MDAVGQIPPCITVHWSCEVDRPGLDLDLIEVFEKTVGECKTARATNVMREDEPGYDMVLVLTYDRKH